MNNNNCKSSHNSESHKELYFLIAKFLSSGPCKEAAKVLQNELIENGLLPVRYDYLGNRVSQTLEELSERYPHIQSDTLLQVCQRLRDVQNNELPKGLPSVSSFLASGRSGLLFSKAEKQIIPFHRLYARRRGYPLSHPAGFPSKFNIVRTLEARTTSGPLTRKHLISPKLYGRLGLTHQTIGHISAVYCVLYDYTGRVIFTGADDLLVKVWSTISGRLQVTFRGASSEITDLAINLENTMLAAGSLDRVCYVWCLQTTALIAQLNAPVGMITGVNFCPSASDSLRYLASTSTDGSVAFWIYTHKPMGRDTVFLAQPILFNEKMRPGVAQMICSAFSSGGTFLAAGSADHHVRVYYVPGDGGPQRIMEEQAHTDRVDSIQWANRGLRFVSGSKDGTALIWRFSRQKWINIRLDTTRELAGQEVPSDAQRQKPRVSMVCWDKTDRWIITAVHDASIKVWNSETGELVHILRNHRRDVFVLEPHPLDEGVLLSAGHDGLMCVWDIIQGKCYIQHQNLIENMGHKSFYDAKWSPDGTQIVATDSNGSVLYFSIGPPSPLAKQLPKELFFNTDYWPIMRENEQTLDETTGEPLHLLGAPFLVRMEGSAYPPDLQKLVPGRENEDNCEPFCVPDTRDDQTPGSGLRDPDPSDFPAREVATSLGNVANAWRSRMLIPLLPEAVVTRIWQQVEATAMEEMNLYEYEKKLPVITPIKHVLTEKKPRKRCRRPPVYQTRAAAETTSDFVSMENLDLSPSSKSESDASEAISYDSGGSSSTEYSDWIADHGVSLEPPTRSRRQRRAPARLSPKPSPRRKRSVAPAKTKEENKADESDKSEESEDSVQIKEVPIEFLPPKWLSEVVPRKAPYYPQMGDYVMFFQEGYKLYLDAVRKKQVYKPSNTHSFSKYRLDDPVFVQVVGIKYEIRPPRLCCLRLAVMRSDGKMSNQFFNIKYHDIPDVIDFLVLKQIYEIAMKRQWKTNDRFRCMIDDSWWLGNIVSSRGSGSPFLSLMTKWDNGEEEPMSPWDLEPVDPERLPEQRGGSIAVLPEETLTLLYCPRADEWPSGDRDGTCDRIIASFDLVMTLSIAEAFCAPVDLNLYPSYAMSVEYPIDLSTIKARLENRFYRRLTALQFDVRYLATNAEKFNNAHSQIVKYARIVTDLCLKIIKDQSVDVIALYRQLADTYVSNSEGEDSSNADFYNKVDWKSDCERLLRELSLRSDSQPFREPVDLQEFPDYLEVVKTPMDLWTVRNELLADNYSTPKEFEDALRLIIDNSRKYNTNKRSRIYSMSLRLSNLMEARMKQLSSKWKSMAEKPYDDVVVSKRKKLKSPPPGPSGLQHLDPLAINDDNIYESVAAIASHMRLTLRKTSLSRREAMLRDYSSSDSGPKACEIECDKILYMTDSDSSNNFPVGTTNGVRAKSTSSSDNDDQVLSTIRKNVKDSSLEVNGHSYAKKPEESSAGNGNKNSESDVTNASSPIRMPSDTTESTSDEKKVAFDDDESSSPWSDSDNDVQLPIPAQRRNGTRKSNRTTKKENYRTRANSRRKRQQTNGKSSVDNGSSSDEEVGSEFDMDSSESEGGRRQLRYTPKHVRNGKTKRTTRTRRQVVDSEDSAPIRRKRQKRNSSISESSNWQPSDDCRTKKRQSLRRRAKSRSPLPSSDSDESSDTPKVDVSSRGRVRKLTQRAKEAFRK